MPSECFVCRKHQGLENVPGGAIFEDELVFISHAQLWGDESRHYLGHVFVEPKRHTPQLSDLTKEEAQAIGYYTSLVAKALVEILKVEHVYSFVLGHHVDHLHIHVVGRYPGTPREYWGMKVDEWSDAPKGTEEEIAAITEKISDFLKAEMES